MASIVVAGDVSGTVTLSAPATAGTTTLTLPTTSGTIVVNSGAQTIEFADGSASAPSITNSGDTNTGMFFPAEDTIAFTEGGVEAMRLDSSGNVGIGTAIPNSRLHVSSGAVTVTGASSTTARINMFNNAATTGGLLLGQGYASGTDNTGYIFNVSNAPVVFGTNDTERMRIDSNGNVMVGTTGQLTPGGVPGTGNILNTSTTNGHWALALQNNGTAGGSGRGIGIRNATDFNNASNEVWYFIGNATPRGYFLSNGGLYNFQANNVNISDRSTKKDITPAKNYLDIICSIPVVTFLYNDQTDNDLNLGVIAQDVEAIAPELITITKLGVDQDTNEEKVLKGIYQTDLQYALMKCIQEQQAIIETLKADIAELKTKVGK